MITVYNEPAAAAGSCEKNNIVADDRGEGNYEEELDLESPPTYEVNFGDEEYEVRSVAEASEDDEIEQPPQLQQQYELPSPESIMRIRMEGRRRMREELQRRAEKRQRESQSPSMNSEESNDHELQITIAQPVAEEIRQVVVKQEECIQYQAAKAVEQVFTEHEANRSRNNNTETPKKLFGIALINSMLEKLEAREAAERDKRLSQTVEPDD